MGKTCMPVEEYYYARSNVVEVAARYPTRLSIATDKEVYATGERVVVTVRLEYQDERGEWRPLGSMPVVVSGFGSSVEVVTGPDGYAAAALTAPDVPGVYEIRAEFRGSQSQSLSRSRGLAFRRASSAAAAKAATCAA